MASVKPELYLYNLTLSRGLASVSCLIGNFTNSQAKKSKRAQELIVATSSVLSLYRFNSSSGKLNKLFSHDTFSSIRCVSKFRVSGATTDAILVTSDSGSLTVLRVNSKNELFEAIHNDPYSKTGVTRLTPGEFVSVDDKSRAVMISAIERNKLVYVLNRDLDTGNITISSPLEANKSKMLTFFTCGLDVGYENPVFTAIEADYAEIKRKPNSSTDGRLIYDKILNYYELDLGLNHVVKKYSEKIDQTSNFMIPIPGGLDGPSGVLLCSKDVIQYKYFDQKTHIIPIPKRLNSEGSESYIINGVVHKMKSTFFILLQNNFGDLFKVNFDFDSDTVNNPGEINYIEIKYFDTLPIMKSLLIFKSGFLFADSENGDKYVYQFEKTGDEEDDSVWRSTNYSDVIDAVSDDNIHFEIKSLDNLGLVDIMNSLSPIMDSKLLQIPKANEVDSMNVPTIVCASGSNARSALKILTREVPISELVSTDLPADAQKVFTTRVSETDEFDKYLILSFLDGTLVLSIGESVEEVTDSGLSTDGPTILVQQMGPKSLAQVQHNLVRLLTYDPDQPTEPPTSVDWLPPAGIEILSATATQYQLVVGLSNRELVYFEHEQDHLREWKERPEMLGLITSISLEKIDSSTFRSKFLAVGTSENTIHILSVEPASLLEELAVQALSSTPVSLEIMKMLDNTNFDVDQRISSLYLHIGMRDGIYARIRLDEVTGAFGDVRSAVVGLKPVQLSAMNLFGQNMISCFSSRAYLGFTSDNDFALIPVANRQLTHGFGFKSEDCPENGIVGVYSNVLTIFSAHEISSDFNFENIPLRYTPRKFCEHNGLAYVIECDYNVKSSYIKNEIENDEQVETEENEDQEIFQQFGYPEQKGQWAACIQTVDLVNRQIVQTIELSGTNESFVSLCVIDFGGIDHLVVGTTRNQSLLPNKSDGFYLRVYELLSQGLKFKHTTKIDGLPLSIVPFNGKLLVGAGNNLVFYDLGLKQLLRKAQFKTDCRQIVKLDTMGNRIAVADIKESVTFVIYKPLANKFILFATDTISRAVSALKFVDYDTVIGSDRFGEIFVLRCPEEVSKISDEDDHGTYLSTKEENLNTCPFRLDNLLNYYSPDIINSFSKGYLSVNDAGPEPVVYSGLQGTVGILLPILHKSEIDFFVKLQKLIANADISITDRDHLKFRSYYVPCKSIIDGDFIECYRRLDAGKKLKIAGKLDTSVKQIEKRISDIRSRIYF